MLLDCDSHHIFSYPLQPIAHGEIGRSESELGQARQGPRRHPARRPRLWAFVEGVRGREEKGQVEKKEGKGWRKVTVICVNWVNLRANRGSAAPAPTSSSPPAVFLNPHRCYWLAGKNNRHTNRGGVENLVEDVVDGILSVLESAL